MARALWVENITDKVKRTSILEAALREKGYKLPETTLYELLRKNGAQRLVDHLKTRRVVVGPIPEGSGGLAYGVMRLDDKYAFYITNLRLTPEGFPEFRLVIENIGEFDAWFAGFIEVTKSRIIPLLDSQRTDV